MGDDFYCEEVFSGRTKVDVVFETENVLAFEHTRPFWEHHVVVVPKKHISSLLTLTEDEDPLLLELHIVLRKVAGKMFEETGAARVLTNLGSYQDSKHLHYHVYSGDEVRP